MHNSTDQVQPLSPGNKSLNIFNGPETYWGNKLHTKRALGILGILPRIGDGVDDSRAVTDWKQYTVVCFDGRTIARRVVWLQSFSLQLTS